MDKKSYCERLKEEYHVEELESKTLVYRIDGFIKACNMNLDDCVFFKDISPMRLSYINTYNDEEGLKYNINFLHHFDRFGGKSFLLHGRYNELIFTFSNYYSLDQNHDRINEIPFILSMKKANDEYIYLIRMETVIDSMTRFIITKTKENESLSKDIIFYSNIEDFSNILKLTRSFVDNPENVFNIYSDIMNKKEVVYTRNELGKALTNDAELDKPIGKTRKKIKMILNNH